MPLIQSVELLCGCAGTDAVLINPMLGSKEHWEPTDVMLARAAAAEEPQVCCVRLLLRATVRRGD